jgi:hypothetical protein
MGVQGKTRPLYSRQVLCNVIARLGCAVSKNRVSIVAIAIACLALANLACSGSGGNGCQRGNAVSATATLFLAVLRRGRDDLFIPCHRREHARHINLD